MAHYWGFAVVDGVSWLPTNNWMSCSWNGIDTISVPYWLYSPGSRRKKNAIQARSEMDCWWSDPHWATALMVWRMDIGRGRNLLGRGYYLL